MYKQENRSQDDCKILYVDDNFATDNMASELRDDYPMFTAASGTDAMSILKKTPSISVVVATQKLADMSGVELICNIREFYPNIQSVLLTNYSDDRVLYILKHELKINNIIKIPMERKKLLTMIKNSIRQLLIY